MVDENAKGAQVGKPITATDDDDVLVYSLTAATPDANVDVDETTLFGIDERTGQITTKVGIDSNAGDTPNDTDTDEDTYTVSVTAVDPSGASGSQDVVITINNVNDAPAFADPDNTTNAKEITIVENAAADALQIATYNATDDDTADDVDDAELNYFLGGDDAGAFTISNEDATRGQLSLKKAPNYETQKEYSVTIMAEDDEFAVGSVKLVVTVTNAEDAGEVTLTVREPQVGKQALASLSDQDGTIRGQTWQWYRNAESTTDDAALAGATTDCEDATETLCPIPGATSPAYTPKATDEGENKGLLAARVTYSDACVRGSVDLPCDGLEDTETDQVNSAFKVTERDVQIDDPANTAPKFGDQDPNTPGDQLIAEREVPENMKTTVGDAVIADDPTDLLMYSVDPDDNFSVDNEGQISTKVELDYEGLPEDAKYYMVTLSAVDPSGASDSIMVKITVTDGPDDAIIVLGGVAPAPDHACVVGGAVADDQSAELAADCQTLLDAMDDLIGDGTGTLNWSASTPIAEWQGVAQRGTGRVGGIYLADAGLSGVIPTSFNDLAGLERLTLRDNDLSGDIPDLSGLDNLEWLVLQRNAFTGGLPDTLGDMASLDYLWIYSNEGGLTGGVPAALGNSTSLRQVWLHDNGLTGGIPAEIGDMSRLRYLILSGNMLTGEIPMEIGNATNLKQLYLNDNMLSGAIPAELGNLMTAADDTLRRLYLHNNMLTGDVPAELGNLVDLTHLRLSGNMLTGCIPAAVIDAADDADMAGLMACAADDGNGDGDGS